MVDRHLKKEKNMAATRASMEAAKAMIRRESEAALNLPKVASSDVDGEVEMEKAFTQDVDSVAH